MEQTFLGPMLHDIDQMAQVTEEAISNAQLAKLWSVITKCANQFALTRNHTDELSELFFLLSLAFHAETCSRSRRSSQTACLLLLCNGQTNSGIVRHSALQPMICKTRGNTRKCPAFTSRSVPTS